MPESEGDAGSMAQWLDMAADAAATAAADALELELKEEVSQRRLFFFLFSSPVLKIIGTIVSFFPFCRRTV